MKYKVAAFDLDGTLVNSLTDLAIAVNYGLEVVGLPTHEVERYKRFVGNGREKLIDRAMGEAHTDKKLRKTVKDSFDSYYAVHCNDNTSGYPGCKEMLVELDRLGVKVVVLSNKPDEFVAKILGRIYPGFGFALAWGKKPEYPEKPDGSALLAMLNKLSMKPADCIYIGDSDVDVFTAKNAGVDMLGVEWGFRGEAELLGAGAPFVAKTAMDIVEYIK